MKITPSLADLLLFMLIIAISLCARWPALPDDDALVARLTEYIEQGQALWLAFVALFILYRSHRVRLQGEARLFWLWAALWWLVLLGRSISWGRVYFPQGPRPLFHSIAFLLIAALLLPLLTPQLRAAIIARYRLHPLPCWRIAAVVLAFTCADAVEHQRALARYLVTHPGHYRDLIEELYECPFLLGLFLISQEMMTREWRLLANPNVEARK
ncbi:nitric oxide reductase [Edwardsiella hoshinae]|uniref:Nitric oxide reductase n=1 Tax=Edwardsiella hoshinae TaxID=93378 RepID=A0ABM6EKM1_9GAMM|nr:nitric oxide reductase [Edwardsiella hoshinae]AOV97648.1 nitric oxide reductase [Edwardsiella hoshinae]